MKPLKLDNSSPVPIYHQIVEAVRYQIATGRLKAGDRLPAARRAAEFWGANFHTVRRAYTELARAGLVTVEGARGTLVAPVGSTREGTDALGIERFLDKTLATARSRFGLTSQQLATYLTNRTTPLYATELEVSVVECNEVQCHGLADQVMARYVVDVRPWCLQRSGEPPPGPVLATYFHYSEIAERWPDRLAHIHFIPISPDRAIRDRVLGFGDSKKIILVEREGQMAVNIVADLAELFPEPYHSIECRTPKRPERVLRANRGRHPVLFAPRVWSELDERHRDDPSALQVEYTFLRQPLEAVARRLGWVLLGKREFAETSRGACRVMTGRR